MVFWDEGEMPNLGYSWFMPSLEEDVVVTGEYCDFF